MYLPDECWAYIHCFLYIKEFCWPRKIPKILRQYISFKVRCYRAQPLHKPPLKNYKSCVVYECTASRGAFSRFNCFALLCVSCLYLVLSENIIFSFSVLTVYI